MSAERENNSLRGKVILVTGGANSIYHASETREQAEATCASR